MGVLKGEGRFPILFGSSVLPVPPYRPAYLARPDAFGEHPTVVIAHESSGVTSGIKALARRLARNGYAVIVPDLTRGAQTAAAGFEWAVSDLLDAIDGTRVPGTEWASSSLVAVLGLGEGGLVAAAAVSYDRVLALLLAGAPLDVEMLGEFTGALMVMIGTNADSEVEASMRRMQAATGRGEWVIYPAVGPGFLGEGTADFDAAAAEDAIARSIDFLDRYLRFAPSV